MIDFLLNNYSDRKRKEGFGGGGGGWGGWGGLRGVGGGGGVN